MDRRVTKTRPTREGKGGIQDGILLEKKNIAKTKLTARKGCMREGNTQTVTESQHAPLGRVRPGGEFFDAFWSPFGSLLAPFWLPFGSLWLPLASFWLTFGSRWLTFGSRWLTFGSLWLPFGSLLVSLGSLLVPFPSLLLTQGSIFSLLLYPVLIFRIFLNFP